MPHTHAEMLRDLVDVLQPGHDARVGRRLRSRRSRTRRPVTVRAPPTRGPGISWTKWRGLHGWPNSLLESRLKKRDPRGAVRPRFLVFGGHGRRDAGRAVTTPVWGEPRRRRCATSRTVVARRPRPRTAHDGGHVEVSCAGGMGPPWRQSWDHLCRRSTRMVARSCTPTARRSSAISLLPAELVFSGGRGQRQNRFIQGEGHLAPVQFPAWA